MFSLDVGLLKTRFRLLPGESLIQPAILVFTRAKDVTPLAMQTHIHRFMRTEKLPRDSSGKLFGAVHPDGNLAKVADAAHASGMKMLLWCAYQMHRPDLDAGFVLCFRRLDTPGHVFAVTLGGIAPDATYEVQTFDGGTDTIPGARLAAFRVEMPRPRDFRLVFYKRTGLAI